jgi:hypothetical protein
MAFPIQTPLKKFVKTYDVSVGSTSSELESSYVCHARDILSKGGAKSSRRLPQHSLDQFVQNKNVAVCVEHNYNDCE